MLNRNTESSLESYYTYYPGKSRTKYFCFLNLRISSLRTHGDSCVLCNLYREANRMRKMSSAAACRRISTYRDRWRSPYSKKRIEGELVEGQKLPDTVDAGALKFFT